MAGTIFRVGAIQVFIGAEDDPPPHVHAFHTGEGWTARFRFSFLSDVVGLYRFRRRGRKPTLAVLNAMADDIERQLAACRQEWWSTHGARHGIGLVNRKVETRPGDWKDGFRAKVALKPGVAAVGIVSAIYDPAAARVTLIVADGRKLVLTAGQHIEEAEEW
jgi:hypothetical protein